MMHRGGWYAHGLIAIETLCRGQRFLCSDDVWELAGPPPDELHNGMGALFNEAKRLGLIHATGRFTRSSRPKAKGRNIQVWESALWVQVTPDRRTVAADRYADDRQQEHDLPGQGSLL